MEGYSVRTIGNRAFAFDGTLVAAGPSGTNRSGKGSLDTVAVRFRVNEWFKGGTNDTVTVDLMPPTSDSAGDETPSYETAWAALGNGARTAHAVRVGRLTKYAVTLEELVASAHVPLDQQVEEQDASERPEHDESAGHLPGNVRPYGV